MSECVYVMDDLVSCGLHYTMFVVFMFFIIIFNV